MLINNYIKISSLDYYKNLIANNDSKQDNSLTNLSFFMPEQIFTRYIVSMSDNLQSVPIFNQTFGAEVLRYSINLPAYQHEATHSELNTNSLRF
ncbi:hypothetical protein [Francisella sp. 19X1-34]|uniref:hypothetical protein n=1 Tax=Francisella sp. 19X1-34 TaxID=3087177 RepID=UPI002E353E93|nr:hypothetical protein [Francisella sp. 19X1-34]MED7787612.1 hypothetical protein [Francisella sp. 19X1-34]